MTFTQGHIFVPFPYHAALDSVGNDLAQKAVYEFDQDGVYIRKWFMEAIPGRFSSGFGGSTDHIAINNGIMYTLWTSPTRRVYETLPDGTSRILFDAANAPDANFRPQKITFDNDGDLILEYGRMGTFPNLFGVVYKVDKDSGLVLHRWTFTYGAPNTTLYDSIWLMEDNKTLLIGTTFADSWEGILSIDLSQGDALQAQEYGKIRSPYDSATFGYYFDIEDIAVIDSHVYATIAPNGFGHNYDSVPITRVGPGEFTNIPMYFSNNILFGGFEDEGFAIDCDPDGIHLWVASQSSDDHSFYKFKRDTGELIKSLPALPFDRGTGPTTYQTALNFAIAGGSGHHGCGCCVPPVTSQLRVMVTLVGAT